MAIESPAFCLFLYLTDVHFRGELQHGGDVSQQKIKCRPIRTREIGGVSLSDVLYANTKTLRLRILKFLLCFSVYHHERIQPPGLFCKKGVLRNFAKQLWQRLFFNKVAGHLQLY